MPATRCAAAGPASTAGVRLLALLLLLGARGAGSVQPVTSVEYGPGSAESASIQPYMCPIQVPDETWPPSAAMAWAHAGMFDVSMVPPPDAGEGGVPRMRTLLLQEGACWGEELLAERFRYTGGGSWNGWSTHGDAWMVGVRDGGREMSRVDIEYVAHPAPRAAAVGADAEAGGTVPGEPPRDGRRCSLAGVSVHRLRPQGEAFELRLQYEDCRGQGGSHYPGKVAVSLEIERRRNCSSNLVPWMCELSSQDMAADMSACPKADLERQKMLSFLVPETTTTKALTTQQREGELHLSVHAKWQRIGPGRCATPGLLSAEQVHSMKEEECERLCFARLSGYAVQADHDPERCRGFAFNAALGECILYRSGVTEVTRSDQEHGGGWVCWAIYVDDGDYYVTDPRAERPGDGRGPGGGPAGSAGGAGALAPSRSAGLRLFSPRPERLPTTATLRRLEPPEHSPNCFESVDWFALEAATGKPASVCMEDTDFPALVKLVPGPLDEPPMGKAPGRVSLERVCVNVCAQNGDHCDARAPVVVVGDEGGFTKSLVAAGLGVLVTAVVSSFLVYFDMCLWLNTRHQRKPNYRLILQEYLPGETDPGKMQELWSQEGYLL